ncbi:hypothetical protein B1C78_16975 [Thioalkalivibrio denitrificans]|uniref:DUF2782 domain-containing protein n=1 Tax=Thioalkalivibrio denitrificans TaxID=108003 RepID=A0A1V3N7A9_9GAMM|nr:DUF2782 domain-containing protein [Thioalkalivibrio denitrificans]OOG20788.1 hypothetical protein B1C78_16975 [Thioalkalivibrio denitrificans]
MKHLPLAALLLLPALAVADDVPPPPPLLDEGPAVTREIMEPQVVIIRRDDEIIEEYRLHGQLYMVRITPRTGPPYYLIDTSGDGDLDTRSHELDPRIMIPAWTIFRW